MSLYSRRHYAHGTYTDQTPTWGIYTGARAMCSDGVGRVVSWIADTADTFFSVPASVKVGGKTVSGFITVESAEGFTCTTDLDPDTVKFVANQYGVNADMLPPGKWKAEPAYVVR